MNLMTLFIELPRDLQYKISNYNPVVLFNLSTSEFIKYDWFKLIKMNFNLVYSRDEATNEQMMEVYLYNCSLGARISCGRDHSVIRLKDGRVMVCGGNGKGQLGIECGGDVSLFSEIKGIPKNVREVICGEHHTFIILTDGTILGCGCNKFGQLGLGDNRDRNVFEEIRGISKNISEVTCGNDHTFLRFNDGSLMSSGSNEYGQLGLGDNLNRNEFKEIAQIDRNVSKVTCGSIFTMIRLTDGTLLGCGFNGSRQLRIKDYKNGNLFVKITAVPKNIVQVVCGGGHTIIRLTDGTLMSCGSNYDRQCGFSDLYQRVDFFTGISGIPKNIVEVICGGYHSVIRLTDGTLMTCGHNASGQLGRGDSFNWGMLFEKIDGIPKNISEIICGGSHTIIRLTDGTLMSCGSNTYGALGLGDKKTRSFFNTITGIPKLSD
ncbi:MAG: chromosome condensation regulator [Hyperionvirus sp.]|uniref:Chromosome condensation regulator n=1 Tax=Hyperionvirus sp. TaxID=2487770 RepID=A0A3G5A724_9VIRU|nr:MAG: chromosome condensation regulator [Hyperionvirus sp.]